MSVIKEQDGLIFTISCALVGVDVNLKKSTLGGEFIYNCPRCTKENRINMNDAKACFSVGETDLLSPIQQYEEVAEYWTKKVESTKDFIADLIARNALEKKHGGTLNLRKAASKTVDFKCLFCEQKTSFSITVEAKTEAPLPTEWLLHSGELTSAMLKEQKSLMKKETLEQRFLLYDKEAPNILSQLIKADELIDVLETKSLTFKGHEKVAFLLAWSDSKNPLNHASEFTARIVSLQHDIKKASTIGTKLTTALDMVADEFESESMKYYVSSAHGADMQKLQSGVEKKARQLLADALLWLNSEIGRLVNDEKIGGE
jgi:transcription elongation factor Elf1